MLCQPSRDRSPSSGGKPEYSISSAPPPLHPQDQRAEDRSIRRPSYDGEMSSGHPMSSALPLQYPHDDHANDRSFRRPLYDGKMSFAYPMSSPLPLPHPQDALADHESIRRSSCDGNMSSGYGMSAAPPPLYSNQAAGGQFTEQQVLLSGCQMPSVYDQPHPQTSLRYSTFSPPPPPYPQEQFARTQSSQTQYLQTYHTQTSSPCSTGERVDKIRVAAAADASPYERAYTLNRPSPPIYYYEKQEVVQKRQTSPPPQQYSREKQSKCNCQECSMVGCGHQNVWAMRTQDVRRYDQEYVYDSAPVETGIGSSRFMNIADRFPRNRPTVPKTATAHGQHNPQQTYQPALPRVPHRAHRHAHSYSPYSRRNSREDTVAGYADRRRNEYATHPKYNTSTAEEKINPNDPIQQILRRRGLTYLVHRPKINTQVRISLGYSF
ncbi:hypothetical protein HK102_001794 [Quaeritorhiza haematococci]|nr:hypothetical protein HK102_001794 [Quaeritorhiza haematococci]